MSELIYPRIIYPDPGQETVLQDNEIHLYVFSISQLVERLGELRVFINEEEELRARRFLNPEHGDRYRCIRGMLRELLASYLACPAGQVEFRYAEHGKPLLKKAAGLHFNLSHSRDRVVYAFCLDMDIGVDIEFMREQKNLPGMIRHVASPREKDELEKQAAGELLQAFYRLWTRKEAFIKANGRGIGMGLKKIYVGVDESSLPVQVSYEERLQASYLVQDLSAAAGYKMAVCIKRE